MGRRSRGRAAGGVIIATCSGEEGEESSSGGEEADDLKHLHADDESDEEQGGASVQHRGISHEISSDLVGGWVDGWEMEHGPKLMADG